MANAAECPPDREDMERREFEVLEGGAAPSQDIGGTAVGGAGGEVTPIRYPDLSFDISRSKFFGNDPSKITEVTDDDRVRIVIHAIGDACAQDPENLPQYPGFANLRLVDRFSKYMNETVKRGNQKRRRRFLVNPEELLEQLHGELTEENHPVAQALSDVEQNLTGEDGLSAAMFNALQRKVLIVTQFNELKNRVAQKLQESA